MSARNKKTPPKKKKEILTGKPKPKTNNCSGPELFPGSHSLPPAFQEFLRKMIVTQSAQGVMLKDSTLLLWQEHNQRLDQARHIRKEFRDELTNIEDRRQEDRRHDNRRLAEVEAKVSPAIAAELSEDA